MNSDPYVVAVCLLGVGFVVGWWVGNSNTQSLVSAWKEATRAWRDHAQYVTDLLESHYK